MTAGQLVECVAEALQITDLPEWDAPDAPGRRDVLVFLDEGQVDDGPLWALAPAEELGEDYVPIDPLLACEILKGHLRNWLLERGWQVQVTLRGGKQLWRLVDCLSVTDGGGDRLDDYYPSGESELSVLCASVVAIARTT